MKLTSFPSSLGALLLACCLGLSSLHAQHWKLVWSDEFDGTQLDSSKWSFMYGDGSAYGLVGWGNNELQYYRSENTSVGNGFLTITAKAEQFGGYAYTSSRIRTINKGDWTYGRFEMRAKLPTGQGLWPAFWMLPTENAYGGWAASGEIDIMEVTGDAPGKLLGTIHYGGSWPANVFSGNEYVLPSSGSFADDFHIFGLEWEQGEIRWYVDGILYSTKFSWYSTGGPPPAPFDRDFHLLLNVAVGGNLPGPPDNTTSFPQTMTVDYVRVYQDTSGAATGIGDAGSTPTEFSLAQNHPNPFNPTTSITYSVPFTAHTSLRIYDVLGRETATLVNEEQPAGIYEAAWDAQDAGGVYFYRLEATGADGERFVNTKKMVLLR